MYILAELTGTQGQPSLPHSPKNTLGILFLRDLTIGAPNVMFGTKCLWKKSNSVVKMVSLLLNKPGSHAFACAMSKSVSGGCRSGPKPHPLARLRQGLRGTRLGYMYVQVNSLTETCTVQSTHTCSDCNHRGVRGEYRV